MTIDPEKSRVGPLDIIAALEAENIEARPIWKPMHLQPVFAVRDFISVEGDVGGEIFSRGLCLPSDIKMTEA
jgi:dTDP-4-amino-4,6-dideoxygalactose transaminase